MHSSTRPWPAYRALAASDPGLKTRYGRFREPERPNSRPYPGHCRWLPGRAGAVPGPPRHSVRRSLHTSRQTSCNHRCNSRSPAARRRCSSKYRFPGDRACKAFRLPGQLEENSFSWAPGRSNSPLTAHSSWSGDALKKSGDGCHSGAARPFPDSPMRKRWCRTGPAARVNAASLRPPPPDGG